jgi:uncharacterized protein (DUF2141 family)
MRSRSDTTRPIRRSALAVALACALAGWTSAAALRAQAEAEAEVGYVVVDIVGLHSDKGRVLAAMYCSKTGFPADIAKACGRKVSGAKGRRVRFAFDAVPAGEFAVSVFHDENANANLDRNFLGIPTEGWGASRDAKANFGPPTFEDARLSLASGELKRIVVHLQY